jgi:hypothetical protein
MAEDPANLILEHVRVMQAEMKEMLCEHGNRLTHIEASIAGLRREQAGDA